MDKKNYVRKTFVQFFYRGIFVSEISTREVEDRNVSKIVSMIGVPEGAFGFKFFDILSSFAKIDGYDKEIEMKSAPLNLSPMHYYQGIVYTIEDIKHQFSKEKILISNLEGNGHKKAILCRTGNWQPLEDSDILVDSVNPTI